MIDGSGAQSTVGILGGMGPYATLEFYRSILDNTPAAKDWDHLRILIDSNPKIPSRTRAFLYGEADPVPMMIRSALSLRDAGADFIVVPCNSAHFFLPRVREGVDVPFLDMVEETAETVASLGAEWVGLIAGEVTVKGRLYEQRLEHRGIRVLQVSDEEQVVARSIIEDAKKNSVDDETRTRMTSLINALVRGGADTVILGCTELPMVVRDMEVGCRIVDSVDVLAKAVVKRAMAPAVTAASAGHRKGA